MRMTLLEMVQDILSDMNSFNVNNIHENQESRQVADIVKSTFYTISTYRYWPALYRTVELSGADQSVSLKPTAFVIPNEVVSLDRLYYNKIEMMYVEPRDFFEMSMKLTTSTNQFIETFSLDGTPITCRNNIAPSLYTIISKTNAQGVLSYAVVDSYNKADGVTLLPSLTLALGQFAPEWQTDNMFIPDIPDQAFPYLLAEAKARCFLAIKGASNPATIADAARLRSRLAMEKGVKESKDTYPNFGRK